MGGAYGEEGANPHLNGLKMVICPGCLIEGSYEWNFR